MARELPSLPKLCLSDVRYLAEVDGLRGEEWGGKGLTEGAHPLELPALFLHDQLVHHALQAHAHQHRLQVTHTVTYIYIHTHTLGTSVSSVLQKRLVNKASGVFFVCVAREVNMQEIDLVLPYTVHNFRAREHVWVFMHRHMSVLAREVQLV